MNSIKDHLTAFTRKLAGRWAGISLSLLQRVQQGRSISWLQYRHAALQNAASGADSEERLAGQVWETAKAVVVRVEMPGMCQEDIQVSFSQDRLRIRGNTRHRAGDSPGATYQPKERTFGCFERRIALPEEIDTARAELSYRDGVITVIVPKWKTTPPGSRER